MFCHRYRSLGNWKIASRQAESEEDLLEHRTDGADALKTSTSGVRSSHRRTYHLWLLILEESCNQKERHSCRSFDLTIIIKYLFFIVPFLSTQHAELPQHSTFIKICPTYLVNNFSVLYKDYHIAIVFQ